MMWLLVAWFMGRVQLVLCAPDYGNRYCGIGAIDETLDRTALAPMAYRVLMPILVWVAEKFINRQHRLVYIYLPLQLAGMAAAFWMTAQAVGEMKAMLIAACLGATFRFDYWDWIVELFALAAALAGDYTLALFGGIAHAASRETAPLTPLTYWLVTGDAVGGLAIATAVGATMLAIRLYVGKRELYCDRWMLIKNTYEFLRDFPKMNPAYLSDIAVSIALTVLTIIAVVSGKAGAAWIVPLLILVTGWLWGKSVNEPRIMGACLLWIVSLF